MELSPVSGRRSAGVGFAFAPGSSRESTTCMSEKAGVSRNLQLPPVRAVPKAQLLARIIAKDRSSLTKAVSSSARLRGVCRDIYCKQYITYCLLSPEEKVSSLLLSFLS